MTRAEKFLKFADTDDVRQNLKRKSVRGVLFMVSAQGIDLFIRLASTFLLARLLSPTDFGLVAMVFSVTAIAEQISEFGLSTATIQCRELSHPQVTNLFWINFGAGCLLGLLICGLAPGIASFYRNPELLPMTLLISTTFIWGGLTVQHQALLSRQMKQAHMATIRLSASFLSVVVAIILAINHLGVWALAWREVSRAFFVAAGMWLFCRWIPGWPRRNVAIGELLRYGSHLTLNQLAVACFSQLDRLLMGRSFGASALGMYRQAQQLVMFPVEHINTPICSVASPSLSILQVNPDRYRRYYQRIVLVIGLVTMPIGLFIAIFAEEIAHFLLGPQWIGATVFLRIFGIVAFLRPTLDTSLVVMLTYGLSKRMLVLSVIYYAFAAALMFVGLFWGAVGIALSNIVTVIVWMFPKLYFSFRRTPVTMGAFFSASITPVIASVVMAGGLLFLRAFISNHETAFSLFFSFGLAAILYLPMLFLLPRGRGEIIALTSALISSFQRRKHPVVALEEVNAAMV